MHLEDLSDHRSSGMVLTSENRRQSALLYMQMEIMQIKVFQFILYICSNHKRKALQPKQIPGFSHKASFPGRLSKYSSYKNFTLCSKARRVSRLQECTEVTERRHRFNFEPASNHFFLKGQKMCANTMKGGLFMCHPHTSNRELWLILLIIH